jgi:RNA polymerase sigma-70 factor (ECF subfamily)
MDESTFQSFYDSTKQPLWRYIASLTKDDALADDVFQESYIRFLQSTVEFKGEPQMKSYLYRTATNCMRDHWRKLKRERQWFEAGHDVPAETSHPVEVRHDVEKALDGLSLQQRSLLWLAYAEEYEHKEIAGILKLREKSVKVLLFRAKRKLAHVFKRMGITTEETS